MELFKLFWLPSFMYNQPDFMVVLCPSYQRVNSALDGRIPNNAVDSFMGIGGSNISNIGEVFFHTW